MIPAHHRGGSTVVHQNNGLNISELYGQYQSTTKASNGNKNSNLIGAGQG
jgi:hypothetical protein